MAIPELNVTKGLQRFRQNFRLTKTAAADAMGIRPSSYQEYEQTGKGNNPTIKTLYRLAKAFNVSIDYLVGLTDDPTPRWKVDTAPAAGGGSEPEPAAPPEMTPAELTAEIRQIKARLDAMAARLDAAKI